MRAHAATLNCERILGLPLRGLPLLLELGVCHYGHQDGRATRLRLPFGGVFHNGGCLLPFLPFCGPRTGSRRCEYADRVGSRTFALAAPMDAAGRSVGPDVCDLVVGVDVRC